MLNFNTELTQQKVKIMKKIMEAINKLINQYENELIDIKRIREYDNKKGDHSFYMEYDTTKENINEFIDKLKKLQALTLPVNVEQREQLVCEKCNGTGGYSYVDKKGFNYKACECQTN